MTPEKRKRDYHRRAKRNQKFGGVRKRCTHPKKEWDLCPCPWFFSVTHQGKRHAGKIPGATNEAEARSAYKLIVGRVGNGLPALEASPTDGQPVEQWSQVWLSVPRKRKPSTIASYAEHFRVYINPVFGHRLPTTITATELESFARGLKAVKVKRPLSLQTRLRVAMTVQAFFSFLLKKEIIQTNPAAGLVAELNDDHTVTKNRALRHSDRSLYFTAEESKLVLDAALRKIEEGKINPRWHPFILTALTTGMRLGELIGLKWDAINWHEGYIDVHTARVKGQDTRPKSGRERQVTMPDELRTVLEEHGRRLSAAWFKKGEERPAWVFPSEEGTPLEHGNVRRAWRIILKAAKLDYRKFHALRHTHTSLLLQAGEAPAWVAAQAGRSLQQTMTIYAHWLPGGNAAGANRLAALVTGKDPGSFSGPREGTTGHGRAPRARVIRRKA